MKTINFAIISTLIFACLQASPATTEMPDGSPVTFEVRLDTAIKFTPYILVYANSLYNNDMRSSNPEMIEAVENKNGTYVFKLPAQNKPHYFSVCWYNGNRDVYALHQYLFEPGDHIKMLLKYSELINDYDADFEGAGAAKYSCKDDLATAEMMELDRMIAENTGDDKDEYKRRVRLIEAQFNLVEKYKPQMSEYAYFMLKVGIACTQFGPMQFGNSVKLLEFVKMNAWFNNFIGTIPENILCDSKDYLPFKLQNIKIAYNKGPANIDYEAFLNEIKNTNPQLLRDRLITVFYIRNWNWINRDFETLLNGALSIVKDKECVDILKTFKRTTPGDKAYNFSLANMKGEQVTLDQFKGKVVFVDFWFTGCAHCENYFKNTLLDVEKKYEDNSNIVFISVSIDKSREKWLNSVASGNYTSAHAVNLYTNGEGEAHPLIKYYNIRSYPRPFLIDRNGKVIKATGNNLRQTSVLRQEIEKALAK